MSENEKTIRNPSAEEIKKIATKDAVQGKSKPIHKLVDLQNPKMKPTTQTNVSIINEVVQQGVNPLGMKESSAFEPEPVLFKLPSNNFILPHASIFVRRMTTVEEGFFQGVIQQMYDDKRLNTSAFLEAINRTLDNCIRSNVSVYDLSLIDKIPIFIKILTLTYGSKHKFMLTCMECGKAFEHELDISKLNVRSVPANYQYPKILPLKDSFKFPVTLTLSYPLIRDEALWTDDNATPVMKFVTMIQHAEGEMPDGTPLSEEHFTSIASNLGDDDKKEIKKFIIEFSKFGSDIKTNTLVCLDNKCASYKKKQEVIIPIETLFLNLF